MFTSDRIKKFSPTELEIYQYVTKNPEQVLYMTIRELAGVLNTSTSSILRFCEKIDCANYSEFKESLKLYLQKSTAAVPIDALAELQQYFSSLDSATFEEEILSASKLITASETIIFIGIGSSGSMANYGARLFANFGKLALALDDEHYPKNLAVPSSAVIVLSESGESDEVIQLINTFKQQESTILSITNSPKSTVARLSDWNLAYNLKHVRINGGLNATTQVPVLFILEELARRL